jgi:YidC/Oxa1 family membrane protein insertase
VRIRNNYALIQAFSVINKLIITVAYLFCFSWLSTCKPNALERQDISETISEKTFVIWKHVRISEFIQGELFLSGSTSQNYIELEHYIQKTEYPGFYSLSIILLNNSNEVFDPSSDDSLLIHLGPLAVQNSTNNIEHTPSDNLIIEAVASRNGKVQTCRIPPNQSLDLPWGKSQIKWTGLQDRYNALLIFPAEMDSSDIFLPFRTSVVLPVLPVAESTLSTIAFPVLSLNTPLTSLAPGEQETQCYLIFSGPKSLKVLTSGPVNIKALLFADVSIWMRWLCFGLLGLLNVIFHIIPNWGIAIILLAFVVRLLLYPFASKAMKSQQNFVAAQKRLLPELKDIKKKYKGGEQSERILELYKKYKVSPFSGLKPLLIVLIQLPILLALYHVLGSVYELRDASFIWIDSLAKPDHLFSLGFNIPILGSYFNLLPLIMTAFTLLSFRLSPGPASEKKDAVMQKVFMVIMAFSFFILFYSFPSGMVLYWTFANVFQLVQQRMKLYYSKV